MKNIAIIGLPNVGKTTLYNQLTISKNKVGNWAGTTTNYDKSFLKNNKEIIVYDLPGCYNLFNPVAEVNIEQATINYVQSFQPNYYINVINYDNFDANLSLTIDILSLKIPTIIIINSSEKKLKLDTYTLSNILGTKVLIGDLLDKKFINQIIEIIQKESFFTPDLKILYPKEIRKKIQDESKNTENLFQCLKYHYIHHTSIMLESKNRVIRNISLKVLNNNTQPQKTKDISNIIDLFFLNKYISLPLFFIVIYLLFKISIGLGGIFQDLITNVSDYYIFNMFKIYLSNFTQSKLFFLVFFDGILGSLILVITFIPVLFLFFFLLSVLEQTGYLNRVAFIMDRFMNFVGLTGKSIIPITIGFGCTVPSIISSNMIESKNKRYLTMLSSHFVSCTARLAVYIVLVSMFFSGNQNLIIFSIYILGLIVLFLSSYLLNNFSKSGLNDNFLIMELPKYRLPKLKLIFPLSIHKLFNFVFKAGKLIIPLSFLLTMLSNLNTSFNMLSNNESIRDSILYLIASKVNWIFEPLGFAKNNYESTVAIFVGLIAKEGVIGALDSLYTNSNSISNSFTTIPNFFIKEILKTIQAINDLILSTPFSFDDTAINTQIKSQVLNKFGNIHNLYTYLIFISLYSPCISVLSTLKKETGAKFMIFTFIYTTLVAYFSAFIFHFTTIFSNILIVNILFTILLLVCITILVKKIMDLIKKIGIIKYN
jgi:ferrous iron transport protein B